MNVLKHMEDIVSMLQEGRLLEAESLEHHLMILLQEQRPENRVVAGWIQHDYTDVNEKLSRYRVALQFLKLAYTR